VFRLLTMAPVAMMLLASPLTAQADPLGAGRAAMNTFALTDARRHLEEAVRLEPDSYEANWRLSLVVLDLGKQLRTDDRKAERNALYAEAEKYARRAIAANPAGADGHFALANALGRVATTKGTREKLKLAAEIKREAERAVAIDPRHHGALHVLGRWHAEVKGLSGTERFVAKNLLGGKVLGSATWDDAERYLREAVRIAPNVIYHRLDLAEVFVEREKWAEANAQINAIASMPPRDPMDPTYKERARLLGVKVAPKLAR
jgi:tetratricopeptide (TPR) repeat protein